MARVRASCGMRRYRARTPSRHGRSLLLAGRFACVRRPALASACRNVVWRCSEYARHEACARARTRHVSRNRPAAAVSSLRRGRGRSAAEACRRERRAPTAPCQTVSAASLGARWAVFSRGGCNLLPLRGLTTRASARRPSNMHRRPRCTASGAAPPSGSGHSGPAYVRVRRGRDGGERPSLRHARSHNVLVTESLKIASDREIHRELHWLAKTRARRCSWRTEEAI
jgi:hypothetical protein